MNKADLEKLLKNRQRGEFMRDFLGLADVQRVTLKNVFPGSGIVVLSPVEFHNPWPAIVIQGPEFQINFLHDHLLKLIHGTASQKIGKWDGICKKNAERIDLSYRYGKWPWDRVNLAEYIFRRDAIRFANLKLAEAATMDIVYEDRTVLDNIEILLPEEVENGTVEVPSIAFLQ